MDYAAHVSAKDKLMPPSLRTGRDFDVDRPTFPAGSAGELASCRDLRWRANGLGEKSFQARAEFV
jgi:hypothetical protein